MSSDPTVNHLFFVHVAKAKKSAETRINLTHQRLRLYSILFSFSVPAVKFKIIWAKKELVKVSIHHSHV